jgi:hypothetical protein
MVHGARAALPHFLERGSGILINNASLVGNCPSPFHSPYVASKFAIRGLSFALRQEVMHLPDVHVCVLSPASIDTPLWQRGANYSGRAIKPLDPVHPVEQVAEVLLNLIRYPQREVFAGVSGWMASEQYAAQPAMTEALVAVHAGQTLFQDEPAGPTDGSLFKPESGNGGTSGGWSSPDRPGFAVGDGTGALRAQAFGRFRAAAQHAVRALMDRCHDNSWRRIASRDDGTPAADKAVTCSGTGHWPILWSDRER